MDITNMTEEEFLGDFERHPEVPEDDALVEAFASEIDFTPEVLADYGDWKIVSIGPGETALQDSFGKTSGFYSGDTIRIVKPAQGMGLSVPLILFAIKDRVAPPPPRKLTPAGEKALRKAWRVANGKETNPFWPATQ